MREMNWSENITYSSTSVEHPTSVAELQELVAGADTVKALGTRHSFNRVADTAGLQVSTLHLDLGATFDHDEMTATVPGGWNYAQVGAALEASGVALKNMGSLPHISLAGGTATGTHGSGNTNQVLAAEISALELVAADGELMRIDRTDPEFGAHAVGLGAFGVITRVTLDVEPSYLVRQDIYKEAPWDDLFENFEEIMASAYSVNLHAGFSEPRTRSIWQKSRVGPDGNQPVLNERWGAKRLDVVELDPGRITTFTTPGPWCDRLPHFVPGSSPSVGGDELQTEYFVHRNDAVAAIEVLRSMGEQIDEHLHGTEIRTVAADDLWLSPATGRDCVSIGFTWKKHPREVLALLPQVEAALDHFAPTPHWGKLFAFAPDVLAARFPRLPDFLDLARRLDPTGKFANPFLGRLAGNSASLADWTTVQS